MKSFIYPGPTIIRLRVGVSILITSLWLIIITHWSIKVSLFSVSGLRASTSSHRLIIANLRLTYIIVSLLRRTVKVVVCCSLNVFANWWSRFYLLRGIVTTWSFHIVKTLSLFQVFKIYSARIRWNSLFQSFAILFVKLFQVNLLLLRRTNVLKIVRRDLVGCLKVDIEVLLW